jgi:hypothetical protein
MLLLNAHRKMTALMKAPYPMKISEMHWKIISQLHWTVLSLLNMTNNMIRYTVAEKSLGARVKNSYKKRFLLLEPSGSVRTVRTVRIGQDRQDQSGSVRTVRTVRIGQDCQDQSERSEPSGSVRTVRIDQNGQDRQDRSEPSGSIRTVRISQNGQNRQDRSERSGPVSWVDAATNEGCYQGKRIPN